MSARWRLFWILCWVVAAAGTWPRAQSSITLQPSTSPTSGQPGIHNITVTGSNYPAGTIPPANVTVSFAPATAGAGPSGSTAALAVQTIVGSTRRVTFRIPSSILVAAPTAYRVSLSGTTSTGVAFASSNTAALTINPPPSITSIVPDSANQGQALPVALNTTFTNFVQGSTQASFGPGISVGGAAAGGFGPVTVTSATSATAQIAIDSMAAPGPRTVTVRTGVQQATRDAGFTVVQPNQPPVAHAGGPYAGRAGDAIAFDASASSDPDGDALTFTWDFGDGTAGSGPAPAHAYAAAGTFTASVTASDGRGGTHTATATVTISAALLAMAIAEPAEGQTLGASPIVVRGTVNDSTARVVVQDVAAIVTGGTFEARRVPLVEGPNNLLVRARNDRGELVSLVRRVTLDTVPPAITVTSSADGAVRTEALLPVTGLVADATATSCTLGGEPLVVNGGTFSSEATLVPGRNELAIACVDAAGNLARRTLTAFFDAELLAVTGATPADQALDVPTATAITVTFSEPVDPQSATGTTIFLASQSTVLTADLTLAGDARSVTLVPRAPLQQGSRIDLTVTTGVTDAAGIPPPYPFSSSFFTAGTAPAAGTVVGEVFDDTRSLPLEGATVEALDPAGVVLASRNADARGRYLLVPGHPEPRLRISRPGFTIVERDATASNGPLTEILDARLTPLAPAQRITDLLGGAVTSAAQDTLQLLPGSLGGDADIQLTRVSEHGPRRTFPVGWRPLGIVDIAGPPTFAPPATLTVADRTGSDAGTAAMFARYDEASARWIAVQAAVVDGAGTARLEAVNGAGQFALVAADAGAGAPPDAVAGDPLPAGQAAGPIPDSAVGSGTVTP
ncbi:MAG: PKD domain-containing protein, partial [Vicinamibacterales bacterium]